MTGTARPAVLFVCVKNGGKSQMAAALLRRLGDGVEVHSAGTRPGSGLNEESRRAVEEVGASMADEHPKAIDEALLRRVDRVVVLGAEADLSPYGDLDVPVEVWDTDEPSHRGIDGRERMRLVRDDIDARVRILYDEVTARDDVPRPGRAGRG